jgi:hypothetical protein
MPTPNINVNAPDTSTVLPKLGLLSITFGILGILSVAGEFAILWYGWSGHENWLLSIAFLFLPWIALGSAVLGILFGKDGILEKGNNRILSMIGLLISLLPFFLCCLLLAFFVVGSGGLMGYGFLIPNQLGFS